MEVKAGRGLKYATSFDEKILGIGCDVDVTVDVETGEASATIAMRQFLRSSPAFKISADELSAIGDVVKKARASLPLLEDFIDGSQDHQLNYSSGGASLIIVHPKGKPARFVLNIGMFNKEGVMDELSSEEIDAAVKRVGELTAMVKAKLASKKK